jgi:hypothetical protein
MGFSLGTVITFNCMKTLYKFYKMGVSKAGRIIFDVFLLGGAAVLNPNGTQKEIYKWSKYCTIINGRLNNCYSNLDYVLKYMFM